MVKRSKFNELVRKIVSTMTRRGGISYLSGASLPQREHVYPAVDKLFVLFFPGYTRGERFKPGEEALFVGRMLGEARAILLEQVERCFHYCCVVKKGKRCACAVKASRAVTGVLETLPAIRQLLKDDVRAAYEGDPAAKSYEEIILSYPCIEAIATHRLAHEMYKRDVPLMPRIISERTHGRTGIDIHPGARIGKSFFIDHGTGVVIGETAVIGDNVKIYQGVTLGALSFPKDERGRVIKGGKRHPTLEKGVTIYAGATILGGKTVIGKGAVVGGNVWITESVPAGAKVLLKAPEQTIISRSRSKRRKINSK